MPNTTGVPLRRSPSAVSRGFRSATHSGTSSPHAAGDKWAGHGGPALPVMKMRASRLRSLAPLHSTFKIQNPTFTSPLRASRLCGSTSSRKHLAPPATSVPATAGQPYRFPASLPLRTGHFFQSLQQGRLPDPSLASRACPRPLTDPTPRNRNSTH